MSSQSTLNTPHLHDSHLFICVADVGTIAAWTTFHVKGEEKSGETSRVGLTMNGFSTALSEYVVRATPIEGRVGIMRMEMDLDLNAMLTSNHQDVRSIALQLFEMVNGRKQEIGVSSRNVSTKQ